MSQTILPLERLEAVLSTWAGQKILVHVPIGGTARFAFLGTLVLQYDCASEPQFLVMRENDSSFVLCFYTKDVMKAIPSTDIGNRFSEIILNFPPSVVGQL